MHDDTDNTKRGSDATPPERPPDNPSEAEFLDREAAGARGAVARTLDEMRASLKDAGDVRAWARTYPWSTLGVAAAAGFLVAAALVPKRRSRDHENAALLERILTDEKIEARLRELAEEDVAQPSRAGLLHTMADVLVKTFGPAIQTAVASALAARAAEPASPNGQPAQEPAEPGNAGDLPPAAD
jgi:hypothetical protein